MKNSPNFHAWKYAFAFVFGLILTGCAGSKSSPNPFEGAPGVLGSMAQARATPQQAARDRQQGNDTFSLPPQSVKAAADSEAARAALKSAEEAYSRGEWESAASQFKALTASYPHNGQIWFGFGAASALVGKLDDAAQGFETVLSINVDDARAAYNLGLVRLSQANLALHHAHQSAGRVPAALQEEIENLRRDLEPLFGRIQNASGGSSAPDESPVPARVMDPSKASAPQQDARSQSRITQPSAITKP